MNVTDKHVAENKAAINKNIENKINKQMLKSNIMSYIKDLINNELANLGANEEYWGSNENVNNENEIYDFFLSNNVVTQEWFDAKLNYTNEERLEALYNVL